jgi:hypothetical protein
MVEYRHFVSGIFAHCEEAENGLSRLLERGLPRERLHLLDADSAPPVLATAMDSNEVLTNVLVDGAVGTAVGTGIGALAQVALVAANVSLFIASPVIAPLVMLGWGASLGGLIGAAAGAQTGVEHKDGWLSDLIRDAIASGHVVLAAQTLTTQETAVVREVIEALVGESKDVVSAVAT